MTRYKLQTYQFGIVSGIRQEISDRISSALPGNLFAPEARKGQLFVLTEAVNDNVRGKEACDLVASVITTTYYKDSSFSITSSLRKSLEVANKTLYEHNFKAAHHQKTAVSVTCAVLRGNDLYIAQVQPTQAYIAHKGQLRALPTYPSWDAAASSSVMLRPNALGTSLFSEPELFRNVIEPGDVVVLCSSRLARLIGRHEAERLFCLEDAPSALEELYTICRRNTLAEAHIAMLELLPLVSAAAQDAPLSPEGLSERGKAAATAVGDWISTVTGNAALLMRRPADETDAADEESAEPGDDDGVHPTSALTEEPKLPNVLEEIDPRDMNWLRGRPRYRPRNTADQDAWPPSAYIGEGSLMPAINAAVVRASVDLTDHDPLPVDFAAIPQRDPVPPPTLWARITSPFRIMLAALATFFANVGRKRRPSAAPLPRFEQGRGLSYRRKTNQFPLVKLTILLALIGGTVFYLRYQTQQETNRRYDDAFNAASATLAAAQKAPSDDSALGLLDQLDTSITSLAADSAVQNDPVRKGMYQNLVRESEQLRASITRTSLIDDLDVVATLPLSDTISHLLAVPGAGATDLYYLASQSGIVYQQPDNKLEATVVLSPNSPIESFIGPFIVGPIRSIVWREVGTESALAAIDESQFSPSTVYLGPPPRWFTNRLDGSEFWPEQPFPDIESFGGNLYIWEWGPTASGEIKKYASGEYASLPTNWITQRPPELKLETAIDMAIDGRIYLLQPTGEISVFQNGAWERNIPAPSVEPKLTSARKMFLTIEQATQFSDNQGHVFILDPLNERVLELDLQGAVIQQIKVPDSLGLRLSQLTDLAVVQTGQGKQLYLANGNQILRTRLPDPPKPRTATPASGSPSDAGNPPGTAPTTTVPTPTQER